MVKLRNSLLNRIIIIGCLGVIIFFLSIWQSIEKSLSWNLTAITVLKALLTEDRIKLQTAESKLESYSLEEDDQANWLLGVVANHLGDIKTRDMAWGKLMKSSNYILMIEDLTPDNNNLAFLAVKSSPDNPEAWFWLAKTVIKADRQSAITFYQRGLKLSPNDGIRWNELGDALSEINVQEALDAYLQSCYHGDPGANGCWSAGRMEERLGDIQSAIKYYSMSRWSESKARALELEKNLIDSP